MKLVKKLLLSDEVELRERLFRVILLSALLATVMAIVTSFFRPSTTGSVMMLLLMGMAMGIGLVCTFRYRNINMASYIMGFSLILIILPSSFLGHGGIYGGAAVWFVMGIFYVFLMFEGPRLVFFVCLALMSYGVTYYISYKYPELVTPLESVSAIYVDSFFSICSVAMVIGIMEKYQIKIYKEEKNKVVRQKEELEINAMSKTSFFANMSHEIRTPINTIIGLNEVILRSEISDEVAQNAIDIQNASKMLLELINDILDISQIETDKMEIIPVNYSSKDMFMELIDMIRVRMNEKNLDFLLDIDESLPAVLYGDERRIKQIILNLLTNAVKYTIRGSVTLSVECEYIAADKISMKVAVQDTGIGIKTENIDYLFDVFSRISEDGTRKIEGSGLGLPIVKQLVDLMGGTITVDSIYTKGSVFTVTIEQTVIDTTPIGIGAFSEKTENGRKPYVQSFEAPEARVLVVDDAEMNLVVVKKLLEATKVQIDTASSASECLERTLEKSYDLIILDYQMPEMDGVATMNAVKVQQNGLCRTAKFIVLTASAMMDKDLNYQELGFDGYIVKPINGRDMETEILRLLPPDIVEYRYINTDETLINPIQLINSRKLKRICITTDTLCDLPKEVLMQHDVKVMYLYIRTEHGRFCDTKEIDASSLKQYISTTSSMAHTEFATVEEFEQFFGEALLEADEIIHISSSSALVSSYELAKQAARGHAHVHVIDSGQISSGLGMIILSAANMVKEGKRVHEIIDSIEQLGKDLHVSLMLPSLKIISQRGYVRSRAGLIYEKLQLHPVLKMVNRKLTIVGVTYGNLESAWKKYIRSILRSSSKIDKELIVVTYAGLNVKQLELLVREIKKKVPFKTIMVNESSVSNACNSGYKSVAISYLKRKK